MAIGNCSIYNACGWSIIFEGRVVVQSLKSQVQQNYFERFFSKFEIIRTCILERKNIYQKNPWESD